MADTPDSAGLQEGFYSILYQGPAGQGVVLVCLKAGRMVGADMGGGVLEGTYVVEDGSLAADCLFRFSAGRTLVTGQTLAEDLEQRRKLNLSLAMLAGERSTVDIGFGPLTARGKFIADPI
jgi:hypothetical protein